MSLIDVDDEALLRRIAARGDEDAFRALYARHTPAVYGLLSRLTGRTADASDVMQETWLRAVRHLSLFRGQSAFRTWLTGIALNCYREWRRRHARETPLADALEHREVIVLHDVEGYTHEEIAETLEIEPGTSRSRLSRARRDELLAGQGQALRDARIEVAPPPPLESETVALLRERGLIRRWHPALIAAWVVIVATMLAVVAWAVSG